MAVLYRKYRPQQFAMVVNQKPVIQTLLNQVAAQSVAHAYLFTGSRGVGKTSVARILAKAVNCLNRETEKEKNRELWGDACGQCVVCKAIENNNFIDLIEIDAASNTGVDNVREIIEHVKFSPSLGKYKVFIIDEVHMLSKGAFNALLKTLEEPPKHAIFILATTEIQKVPATIISRTQRFDFRSLSSEDIQEHLLAISKAEGLDYSREILELVSRAALGSVRDALSILGKISTLGKDAKIEDVRVILGVTDQALLNELLEFIGNGQATNIPDFFDRLLEMGADFAVFNRDLLERLRELLVKKITSESEPLTEKFSITDLIYITRLFLKAYKDQQGVPSPEIPLLLAGIEAALKKTTELVKTPLLTDTVLKQEVLLKKHSSEPEDTVPLSLSTYESATVEEVREFWPKVVGRIKEQNGPLGSLLKACPILEVENGRVILQVRYEFDRKTLERNTGFITETISGVAGKNLGINGRVGQQEAENSSVAALSDALKIFGGEIIE